ncbi:MAG: hypothetical protein AAFQ79_13055 [Pseudomonadota bacterium]
MFYAQLDRLRTATGVLIVPSRFDAIIGFQRLTLTAIGMVALTLGMLLLDGRMLDGEPVWLKPFKFAVSFAILFATLTWAAGRLSTLWRTSWGLVGAAAASAAAFFFEMAYIGAQAARQEPSHFNETTPFHEMMYGFMGTGATALMLTVGIVGVAAWADRDAHLQPRLRLSIVLGFFLTVVLTFWVAGELAGNGGRYIGVPSPQAAKLPILGWSMEVGDLRPAHFFSLHAMQFLPLFGWLADRYDLSSRMVWIAALFYASFNVMIFLKALQGVPLISA